MVMKHADATIRLTKEGDGFRARAVSRADWKSALEKYLAAKSLLAIDKKMDPHLEAKILDTLLMLDDRAYGRMKLEQAQLVAAINRGGVFVPRETVSLAEKLASAPLVEEPEGFHKRGDYGVSNDLIDVGVTSPLRGRIFERAKELVKEGREEISLAIGDLTKVFPTMDYIKEAGIEAIRSGMFDGYADPRGYAPLVQEIARKFGVKETDVVITNGVSEGISFALKYLFMNPPPFQKYNVVVPQEYYYVQYGHQIGLEGGELITVKNVGELEKSVTDLTRAIIVIDPDNPTGRVLARADAEEILRVAYDDSARPKKRKLIMWDRIYMDLVFNGKGLVDLHKMNPNAALITYYGFAKARLLTGQKIGAIIMQGEGLDNFKRGMLNLASVRLSVNAVGQAMAYATLVDPRMDEDMRKMADELGERAKIVKEELEKANALIKEKHPERSLELVRDPEGAFYAMIKFNGGPWKAEGVISAGEKFASGLMEFSKDEEDRKFVRVAYGEPFGGENCFRITFLCKTREDLRLAMEKIGRFMANA